VASPEAIVFRDDGLLALVTNAYDTNMPDPLKSSVTVINLQTRKPEPTTLGIPGVPSQIAMVPKSSLALASTWNGNLYVVDVSKRTVEPTPISITTKSNRMRLAVTPDGVRALVVGLSERQLSVVNIAGRKVEKTIPINRITVDVGINPAGTLAFLSNYDGTISVIDLVSWAVEQTLKHGNQPAGIAFTPDGKLALVTVLQNWVSVIDVATRTVEAQTIPTGSSPEKIVISSDGTLALTTNTGMNETGYGVTIIDIARRTGVTIGWPDQVNAAGITTDGKTALVAVSHDFGGYVSVL
jgi:YVTN family beta-propeller protein